MSACPDTPPFLRRGYVRGLPWGTSIRNFAFATSYHLLRPFTTETVHSRKDFNQKNSDYITDKQCTYAIISVIVWTFSKNWCFAVKEGAENQHFRSGKY